jgi:hypothetical protein
MISNFLQDGVEEKGFCGFTSMAENLYRRISHHGSELEGEQEMCIGDKWIPNRTLLPLHQNATECFLESNPPAMLSFVHAERAKPSKSDLLQSNQFLTKILIKVYGSTKRPKAYSCILDTVRSHSNDHRL